jgi:hypothetical protein
MENTKILPVLVQRYMLDHQNAFAAVAAAIASSSSSVLICFDAPSLICTEPLPPPLANSFVVLQYKHTNSTPPCPSHPTWKGQAAETRTCMAVGCAMMTSERLPVRTCRTGDCACVRAYERASVLCVAACLKEYACRSHLAMPGRARLVFSLLCQRWRGLEPLPHVHDAAWEHSFSRSGEAARQEDAEEKRRLARTWRRVAQGR